MGLRDVVITLLAAAALASGTSCYTPAEAHRRIEGAKAHTLRAMEAKQAANLELAIEEYSKGIELVPSARLYFSRAQVYFDRFARDKDVADLHRTIGDAETSLGIDPLQPDAQMTRGLAYLALWQSADDAPESSQRKATALASFDEALTLMREKKCASAIPFAEDFCEKIRKSIVESTAERKP